MFLKASLKSLFSICYRQASPNDFEKLDTLFKTAVKEKQPFVRLEMTKEQLKEMFKVRAVLSLLLTVSSWL